MPDKMKDWSWNSSDVVLVKISPSLSSSKRLCRNIPEPAPRSHVYESRQTDGILTPVAEAVAEEEILQKC